MSRRSLGWTGIALAILGCSKQPSAFDRRLESASALHQARDFEAELAALDRAYDAARSDNERAEAWYRKAHVQLELGQSQSGLATLLRIVDELPSSNRAARSLLDRARVFEREGHPSAAEAQYERIVRDYAQSGGAVASARRIAVLRKERGIPVEVTYAALLRSSKDPELSAALIYFRSVAQLDSDEDAALAGFERLARERPLPHGTYTDEAMLRLARLYRQRSRPHDALAVLEQLRSQDKHANIVGSYVRSTYLDAYLLAAQIYSDDLGEYARARSLLERFAKKHHDTTRYDDALFELVRVRYKQRGDACPAFERLERDTPRSRYVKCAMALCGNPSNAPLSDANRCQNWLQFGVTATSSVR